MESFGPRELSSLELLRNRPIYTRPPGRSISLDPSEGPDFDAMKVERGDVITAAFMNDLIDVLGDLHERVQSVEQVAQESTRSGRTTEVPGIGRGRAQTLAREGIVTLYDLGTAAPENVATVLDVTADEAETIITDAYDLAGGPAGHPLTDLPVVGRQQAQQLSRAGIANLKQFSTANPQTIVQALGVSQEKAKSLKKTAQNLITSAQ
jgi:predicted flap endonuclease-1-like 5' DNA nuclease